MEATEPNYYSVLECNEFSTPEQISTEFRKKSLLCHPDKHPNDPRALEQFQLLQKAHQILSNPELRKDYDNFLHSNLRISFDDWKKLDDDKKVLHWAIPKSRPQLPVDTATLELAKQNQSRAKTEAEVDSPLWKFRNYEM
jgi:DnaJ family protein C protein 12